VPSSSEFNALWNTADGAKPATSTWTNWAGKGEDLRIKRLNLEPLFHQLILVDRDPANQARFSIDSDSTGTNAVPPGGLGWNKYYLDGTVLALHGTNGIVQSRYRLTRSMSFTFESGGWPAETPSRPAYSGSGSDFVNHATAFFAQVNPYATNNGGSQYGVMIAMYTFMFDYAMWANECPHFDDHNNSGSPASVPEYILLNNQGQNNGNIDKFSAGLIYRP